MRRVTVHKPPRKTEARRLREETDEPTHERRPEVRKDIARTWWPAH